MNLVLKMAIIASGQSQRAIAQAAGLDENKLSRLVRGRDMATAAQQKALARVLRRKLSELFPTRDAA